MEEWDLDDVVELMRVHPEEFEVYAGLWEGCYAVFIIALN